LILLTTSAPLLAEEFRGVIGKVDSEKKVLMVEGRGRTRGIALTFSVDGDTRITVGREPGQLADLQPGQRVRIVYEIRDRQRRALSVTAPNLIQRALNAGNEATAASPATPGVPAAPGIPAAPAAAGENAVAGRLAHVGLTEREIVVVGPGSKGEKDLETTLLVPNDVKITKDQKPLKLEELKEGEGVTVRTEKRDGKLVAAAIQLGAAATATTSMKPPAPENNRIQRIRKVLQVADWFLQQLEEQQKGAMP
jgi:hypothetical protein